MAKFSPDSSYIEVIAKILKEYDLREVSIGNKNSRITIKRGEKNIHHQQTQPLQSIQANPNTQTAQQTTAPQNTAQAEKVSENAVVVTAPVVGTVYLSPKPKAPPFVQVGTKVKEGQTVLIIEAMKIMNQIPAPCSGIVSKVSAENAQPVEFGDTLVTIEKA